MSQAVSLLVTIICALLGGLLFLRLKIPGAMIVGAVVTTAVLSLMTNLAYMPLPAKLLAQICAGAFIACSVKRGDLKRIFQNWKAPLLLVLCLLGLNLFAGTVLYAMTDLDRMTCYLAVVPGGITDIPIVAEEMGGDPSVVLAAQFLRLVVGLIVFPLLASRIAEDMPIKKEEIPDASLNTKKTFAVWQVIATLLVAAAGGLGARLLGIPAGTLLGAMLAVLCYHAVSGKACMPRPIRRVTQSLAGAYIGSSVGIDSMMLLMESACSMLFIGCIYSVGCLLIAILLHQYCRLSKRAAMLAAMPAGASDVALIAADMHVNTPEVAVIQIIRMISAVTIFPQVIFFLLSLGFPFF